MVSTLTRTPRCTSSRTTGRTRFCSTSDGMRSAPGRVVSPPTSITSAPAETILTAWAMAPSTWANSPPSLNESGVTLSTPMTWGRMPRAPASGMLSTSADQGHRLRTLHRVGKSAAGGDSNRRAAHLLHAARGDTAVYGVGDHEHTPRGESVGEGVRDLFGQPLLELRSGSERVDHPGQAAEPHDVVRRGVRDMSHPQERQQMVFADGPELDVAQQHKRATGIVGDGVREVGERVDSHAGEELAIRLSDALRGVDQSRPRRVVTDRIQQFGDCRADARRVDIRCGIADGIRPVRGDIAWGAGHDLPYAVAMPGDLRGARFVFGFGSESTPPSTEPESIGAFAGSSTGGRDDTGRFLLDSHCGRSGSFVTSWKISAIWLWSSVSFSSSSEASLSRMSRFSVSTCQASSCAASMSARTSASTCSERLSE